MDLVLSVFVMMSAVHEQNGGTRTTWQRMTRREIFASLIAYSVIGGAFVAVCVHDLHFRDFDVMALMPAAFIMFAVVLTGVIFVQAIRELRRRQKI